MEDLNEVFERAKKEEKEKLESEMPIQRPDITKPKIENGRMVFEKEPVLPSHS